jgi:hypothetical protein
MGDEMTVLVRLEEDPDGDLERSVDLTWDLKDELLATDVESVEHPHADTVPAGAKGDPLAWAELVVTTIGTLPAVVAAVRSWLSRQDSCTVTLEIGGDKLTLGGLSRDDQQALARDWLQRHGGVPT